MVRLSLLVVFVFCLMGQMECNNGARGRGRQKNRPVMNENRLKATMKLDQTQPDEIQVAECPTVCGVNEVCNEATSFVCELGCEQESDLVSEIPDSNIDASSTKSWLSPAMCRLNASMTWIPLHLTADQYLQFQFPDMKIVTALASKNKYTTYWVTKYNVTISSDCVDFNSTLPIIETGNITEVTSPFQNPVLARCVRVNAKEWYGNFIGMNIGLFGCRAI